MTSKPKNRAGDLRHRLVEATPILIGAISDAEFRSTQHSADNTDLRIAKATLLRCPVSVAGQGGAAVAANLHRQRVWLKFQPGFNRPSLEWSLKMPKTPEIPGSWTLKVVPTGLEQTAESTRKTEFAIEGGAKCGALSVDEQRDLHEICGTWPSLPANIRAAVLVLVRSQVSLPQMQQADLD